MPILTIRHYPDPVLRAKTELVTAFDSKLKLFAHSMFQTMYEADGIGLAAPQVGVSQRLAVVDVGELPKELPAAQLELGSEKELEQSKTRLVLVNPKIVDQRGKVTFEEGCLSIPDYRDSVVRFEEISVVAQDLSGAELSFTTDGLLAICIQHELDHLEGILFVDHLSRLKRELFRKRYGAEKKPS